MTGTALYEGELLLQLTQRCSDGSLTDFAAGFLPHLLILTTRHIEHQGLWYPEKLSAMELTCNSSKPWESTKHATQKSVQKEQFCVNEIETQEFKHLSVDDLLWVNTATVWILVEVKYGIFSLPGLRILF